MGMKYSVRNVVNNCVISLYDKVTVTRLLVIILKHIEMSDPYVV